MSPAAVRVKEEPERDDMGADSECGASEAAAASLYAEHEVKRELVLGPERLQPQDIAYTMQQSLLGAEPCSVKEPVRAARPKDAIFNKLIIKYPCLYDPNSINYRFRTMKRQSRSELLFEYNRLAAPAEQMSNLQLKRRIGTYQEGLRRRHRLKTKNTDTILSVPPSTSGTHECTGCHRTFLDEYTLKTHSCIHSAEETSANIIQSQQVLEASKKKQLYSCDYCGKGFTSKGNLTRHKRTHTGEKPFLCAICTKQFSHKQSLAVHMLVHTGEKPFKCNICTKQFSRNENLTRHMLIHSGEKHFSCEICKKRFSVRSNLTKHILIHTGKKPYECDICKKQFSQKSTLTNHMRIHTGEKPFKCNICTNQFSRKDHLASHMQRWALFE